MDGGEIGGSVLGKVTSFEKKDWDQHPPSSTYFAELRRVSKNQIIWGANHFIDRIGEKTGSPCWLVWDKEICGKRKFGSIPRKILSLCTPGYSTAMPNPETKSLIPTSEADRAESPLMKQVLILSAANWTRTILRRRKPDSQNTHLNAICF